MVDITQINYFLTTAKCLNFTDAAAQLFISQPTLSRQITAMESELNMLLFIRDKRSVQLTPAGLYLYKEFTQMYEHYCDIVSTARDENEGVSGSINLGILDGHLVSDFLPKVLNSCFKKYPNIRINLSRGSFKSLADGLYDKTLDVIITLYFDIAAKEKLNFKKIKQTTEYIVVQTSHALANEKEVSFLDFKEDIFILISPNDSPLAASNVIEICMKEGFYPKYRFAPNLETLMLWVEAGIGIAIINNDNSLMNNPSLRLLPLKEVELFESTFTVIAWHDKNPNASIPLFLDEVQTFLK